MKRYVILLCILCLLFGGCSGKSVEEKLRAFYPEATITVNEEGFFEVETPIDVEQYDRVIYGGAAQGHKPVKSLAALQKKYDASHYILVKGHRVGGVTLRAQFDNEGLNYGSESTFEIAVTQVCHATREVSDKITIARFGYCILPHGKERVLYMGREPLPVENEEYFFLLSPLGDDTYSHLNPLASDLKIDEALLTAKELSDAQKLTKDLMKNYLQ